MSERNVSSDDDARPRLHFDIRVALPPDDDFAPMVRALALHGARQAGCPDADAAAIGNQVEDAVRDLCARASSPTDPVNVTVRCENGPLQVVLDAHGATRTLSWEI
jgi:hypothetical protein